MQSLLCYIPWWYSWHTYMTQKYLEFLNAASISSILGRGCLYTSFLLLHLVYKTCCTCEPAIFRRGIDDWSRAQTLGRKHQFFAHVVYILDPLIFTGFGEICTAASKWFLCPPYLSNVQLNYSYLIYFIICKHILICLRWISPAFCFLRLAWHSCHSFPSLVHKRIVTFLPFCMTNSFLNSLWVWK